jgi:integrase
MWPSDKHFNWNSVDVGPRRDVTGEVSAAVKAAGLDGRRRVRFHQIRRSAASHYAAAGGDAVAMLDHSSPSITKRWYLDPRLADRGSSPCDVLPTIGVGR